MNHLVDKMRGFSLIELVIVLVLISILAATAFIVWPKGDFDVSGQAESLASDIRYTQALSVAKNSRYRVDLSSAVQYRILNDAGVAVLIPSINGTIVPYKVGVSHNAPIFYLIFDAQGVPYSSLTSTGTGTPLTNDLVITIAGGASTKQLVVVPETGGVSVQ
jgi:prepilin-type N-terminal cleavage/methylation domain-containing protein